jgi:hypothetical protein
MNSARNPAAAALPRNFISNTVYARHRTADEDFFDVRVIVVLDYDTAIGNDNRGEIAQEQAMPRPLFCGRGEDIENQTVRVGLN